MVKKPKPKKKPPPPAVKVRPIDDATLQEYLKRERGQGD